ncbi:MAG: hypothetical protein N2044_08340 [Cyclobacteriaceae bacterium]|nr:hypothetical protein [Cyclobacteriaceae bacterium]MCX7637837.1 hypothetical protein [Cyclobacteriaceae bacterium]MDW8332251.1 hypothetical protein [Cyclobacteriaceae bacterium]
MKTLQNFLLLIHILGGSLGLITGILSMILKKGDQNHVRTGRIFFYSMMTTGSTSLILAVINPNEFLFTVGLFTLYMIISAKRYISSTTRNRMTPTLTDKIITGIMLAAGILFMVFGIFRITRMENFGIVFITFGVIGLGFVFQDYRNFTGKSYFKNPGLLAHLQRMTGGFIAATTAFLVVNIRYFPEQIPDILFWLLPTFLFTPLIIKWSRKFAVIKK